MAVALALRTRVIQLYKRAQAAESMFMIALKKEYGSQANVKRYLTNHSNPDVQAAADKFVRSKAIWQQAFEKLQERDL